MSTTRRGDATRVIKHADEHTWDANTRNGRPTMHGSEPEFRLAQITGSILRGGERPAMDTNRRP